MEDKRSFFDTAIKIINSVVLVAIPILIGFWGDRISQALDRGKLVESLIAELTNEKQNIRRDIALLALHDAIEPARSCSFMRMFFCSEIDESAPDLVFEIATILYSGLKDEQEGKYVVKVIRERKPLTASDAMLASFRPRSDPDVVPDRPRPADLMEQRQVSLAADAYALAVQQTVLAESLQHDAKGSEPDKPSSGETSDNGDAVDPATLAGSVLEEVSIVFIQYKNNAEMAEALRQALIAEGIKAPGIEKVPAAAQTDVRFAGSAQSEAGQALGRFVEAQTGLRIEQYIDLSRSGYSVPAGQFEIWLNG